MWCHTTGFQIYVSLDSSQFAIRNSKKSSWPVTGLWNRGPLMILNGIKLILDDLGNHLDSYKNLFILYKFLWISLVYTISLESFRSFRGPLFRKPVTGQELFFLFLTANWLYEMSDKLLNVCLNLNLKAFSNRMLKF